MRRYMKGKGWRLFHVTDFQSLMYSCFTFCRIFGMFPYKISALTFEVSKPYYVLSTLIACICCICCIIDVKIFCNIILVESQKLIAVSFEDVCFFTCSYYIMICALVLSGPRMRLFQTILGISSKLRRKLCRKLSGFIYIKDTLATVIMIINMYTYESSVQTISYTNVPSKVSSIYCTFLTFHLNMLYVNCICVLKICFERINYNLARMRRLAINDTVRCSPALIYQVRRNQFFLIELKKLQKQHLTVSDAVKKLNVIFSPQLLATIAMIFFVMTFELYQFVVRWHNGSLLISLDKDLFYIAMCCMLYYMALLALLVWACKTCRNAAHEIRTTIHGLLNNNINEQVKDELHLFSLQTSHCRNIFSAKDFTVDALLFADVVGCITMYMLIPVQFLIALHSCDAKNP